MSSYGYMSYYKPPKAPTLASAAAAKDPYGLAPNNRAGALGIGAPTGFAAPPKTATPPKPAPSPTVSATDPRIAASLAANPYAAGANGSLFTMPGSANGAPTAAQVNNYDLNTDPALQSIETLAGLGNDQAKAAALKQRQDLVLAYGDPAVAGAVLGAGDPIAQAAAQNPTSTVAQLGQSRDRNLKTLDDQLNADNLGYSGYRVTQETQAGQDYQNALAQAAGTLNANLDTVGSNLAAALAGNNGQIVQGINAAADRANANATTTGTDPGAIPSGIPGDPTDPAAEANALATAAGGAGPGGFVSSGGYGASGAGIAPPHITQVPAAELQKLLSNIRRPGIQR